MSRYPARLGLLLLLLLVLPLALGGCSGRGKRHVIGVSLPLSGPMAKEGRQILNALRLRVEEINRQGGIRGVPVALEVRDDRNDPQRAKRIAEELSRRKDLVAVIGPYYTSALLAALPVYDRTQVPVLSPFEATVEASRRSKWFFSLNYSEAEQAEHMAVYLKEVWKKDHVLVIHTSDLYGTMSRDRFLAKAKRLGLDVARVVDVGRRQSPPAGFIAQRVPEAERQTYGAVVLFTRTQGGMRLLTQLRNAGVRCLAFGPYTFADRRLLEELDDSITREVYVASPFLYEIASRKADDFADRYARRWGQRPSVRAPMAHDAVTLIARALARGTTRAKVREFLAGLTWDSAVEGLTGNLYFKPGNRTVDRAVYVSGIKDGQFRVAYRQLVEPKERYVLAQLEERVARGQLVVYDGQPYHPVDVVLVGTDFIRITDVEPKNMTFEAESFLWFKWMNEKIDVSEIDAVNLLGRKEKYVLKEDLTKATKYRVYRVKATYQVPFDLSRFPFDRQTLSVTFAHRSKPSTELMLVVDRQHLDDARIGQITPPEWNYRSRTYSSGLFRYTSTFGDPSYRMGAAYKSKVYFSTVEVEIVIQRILFPYLFNLFVPLFIILAITLLILVIPVDQFVVRINASMTALLSILVYYMAQKSSLPKVGYMMKSDYYFIMAFCFILGLKIVNVLVVNILVRHQKKDLAALLNRWFATFFIPFNVLAYVYITWKV